MTLTALACWLAKMIAGLAFLAQLPLQPASIAGILGPATIPNSQPLECQQCWPPFQQASQAQMPASQLEWLVMLADSLAMLAGWNGGWAQNASIASNFRSWLAAF